jgi:hypothetical protein
MKKIFFSFRSIATTVTTVALLSVLVVACNKNDSVSTPIPAAGVMVFNLAPDKDGIGIALSGNLLNSSPLGYTSYNGIYQNIYTGTRKIEAFDLRDSIFSSSTFNFENNVQYSLFVTGNEGVYKNITVKDEIDSNATAEKAYVRYINAIPDSSSPVVTITSGGTKVTDAPAAFNSVLPFTAVEGGDVTISVNNGSTISTERTIALEKGKVYTALIIGVPGETDDLKKVQIRYVENGSIPAPATDK